MIALRSGKTLVASALTVCSLLAFSGTASAQLASCADILTSPPLAGNPAIFSATSVQATTGARNYCNVSIVYRDPTLVGDAAGYAPGAPPTVDTYQHVRMGFGFPLNTNTGDAAWGGRTVQTAGGGAQGSVAGFTGYIAQTPAAIGLSTDSGHGTADSGSGDAWGYVQGLRPNYGKIKDWGGGRAYCTAIGLAKQMARTYYGAAVYDAKAKYTYWEGFSGGGHMGHTQVLNCPEEYDGFNISSPARDWQQFRQQDSWAAMVNKKAVQLGQGFTTAQLNSATAAATAYCMTRGFGGVNVDGVNVLHDPRSCDWKGAMHVCGAATAPAAPNCITAQQAVLLDQIFDGPRNTFGKLIYYPYSHGVSIGTGTNTAGSTAQVMRYNHFDLNIVANNLFMDAQSIALAGNPAGAILYEDEMYLSAVTTSDYVDASDYKLDRAKARGAKILLSHGTSDSAILFRKDPAVLSPGRDILRARRDRHRLPEPADVVPPLPDARCPAHGQQLPAAALRLGGEWRRAREADPHEHRAAARGVPVPAVGAVHGAGRREHDRSQQLHLRRQPRGKHQGAVLDGQDAVQGREGSDHEQRRDRRPCGALREAELGRKTTARGWPERAPTVTHSFIVGPSRKAIKSLASTIGPDGVLRKGAISLFDRRSGDRRRRDVVR